MKKKSKQVNPNNPGNVEDLQRTAEAHCAAFRGREFGNMAVCGVCTAICVRRGQPTAMAGRAVGR